MNLKYGIVFLLIIAIIALGSFTFLNGISIGDYDIIPIKNAIKLGLDLRGGVYVVLEAREDQEITDEMMNRAIATIRQRVDGLGIAEASVAKQGKSRIRVSIPDIQDQDRALELIGKTAQLEFIDPENNVVLTGGQVVDSKAVYQTDDMGVERPVVTLELNKEGAEAFAEATEKYIGQQISIVLDNDVISSPVVQNVISDGKAVITGQSSLEEASNLSTLIRAGALPINLEPVEIRTVGPTLGQDSLQKSLLASAIGISLVFLFMLIMYRLPGVVAGIALIVYILIFFTIIVSINTTLTLPGIAGLILSIGMAVDANVIIFERIKEELRLGKTLRSAIDAGFTRALSSIIDSNITTVIAGIVLFIYGSGPIKGFSLTLMIGIGVSMFSAIFVTRYLLRLIIKMNISSNKKLYGA